MSNVTMNTSSFPQLTDAIQRNFMLAHNMELENVMTNSGIVREESIALNTGGTRIFAQTLISSPYSGQGSEGSPATQALVQYGYEKKLEVEKHDIALSISYEERNLAKDSSIIANLVD